MNKNTENKNYMGREYIVKEENGIYRGYVQLDNNDDDYDDWDDGWFDDDDEEDDYE